MPSFAEMDDGDKNAYENVDDQLALNSSVQDEYYEEEEEILTEEDFDKILSDMNQLKIDLDDEIANEK